MEPKELWRYTPPESFFSLWSQKCHFLCFLRTFSGISMKENAVRGAGKSKLIFIVQFSIFGVING